MIESIIVGLLTAIALKLHRIGKDLWHFKEVQYHDISIKEKKELVDAITTILIKVEAINTDVSYLEERSHR